MPNAMAGAGAPEAEPGAGFAAEVRPSAWSVRYLAGRCYPDNRESLPSQHYRTWREYNFYARRTFLNYETLPGYRQRRGNKRHVFVY